MCTVHNVLHGACICVSPSHFAPRTLLLTTTHTPHTRPNTRLDRLQELQGARGGTSSHPHQHQDQEQDKERQQPKKDANSLVTGEQQQATEARRFQDAHSMGIPLTNTNTLQHTATHCNTLQHTAAHSMGIALTKTNTLQHTSPLSTAPSIDTNASPAASATRSHARADTATPVPPHNTAQAPPPEHTRAPLPSAARHVGDSRHVRNASLHHDTRESPKFQTNRHGGKQESPDNTGNPYNLEIQNVRHTSLQHDTRHIRDTSHATPTVTHQRPTVSSSSQGTRSYALGVYDGGAGVAVSSSVATCASTSSSSSPLPAAHARGVVRPAASAAAATAAVGAHARTYAATTDAATNGGNADAVSADTERGHNATHRNTLQHTATHCNTLQHTAQHTATHNAASADTERGPRGSATHVPRVGRGNGAKESSAGERGVDGERTTPQGSDIGALDSSDMHANDMHAQADEMVFKFEV